MANRMSTASAISETMSQQAPKVTAVVVTFNRHELLRRCLAALQAQHRSPSSIIVVDNSSTDDTWLTLDEIAATSPIPIRIVRTSSNLGGAGGFAVGIETALAESPSWLWLMDDDCESAPEALSELLRAAEQLHTQGERWGPVGFLASTVLWSDGTPHRMNRPGRISARGMPPSRPGLTPIDHASFVSLLVSAVAVEHCGLPIAEFFIGSDDVEYCWRMRRAGFFGYHVASSRAYHLTPANVGMETWRIQVTPESLDRTALKIRNLVAVNRRRSWGWLRESIRVLLLPLVWWWHGIPPSQRRQLARAARAGLAWRYEGLIRHVPPAPARQDAHSSNAA